MNYDLLVSSKHNDQVIIQWKGTYCEILKKFATLSSLGIANFQLDIQKMLLFMEDHPQNPNKNFLLYCRIQYGCYLKKLLNETWLSKAILKCL